MPEVFKVVRPSLGRLISAIVPEHLAETYRDVLGIKRTVPQSIAFETLEQARTWVSTYWPERGLQIWRAEAAAYVPWEGPRYQGLIDPVFPSWDPKNLEGIKRRDLTRAEWKRALAILAEDGDRPFFVNRGYPIRMLLRTDGKPDGSVVCTDLRLVNKID